MGMYFDFKDYEIEEMIQDLKNRIAETEKPLPKKVMRHNVCIVFRTDKDVYEYPRSGWFMHVPDFETRKDAEKFLARVPGMIRLGDDYWVLDGERREYEVAYGHKVFYHYEIRESDYEQFEDGQHHYEYTPEEVIALKRTLTSMEDGLRAMRLYDKCCEDGRFGNGEFVEEMRKTTDFF